MACLSILYWPEATFPNKIMITTVKRDMYKNIFTYMDTP